jgi:hypothetical protein
VYISTNVDPVRGDPLVSRADGLQHHELFRGVTQDQGRTWDWEPITAHSTMDNLRPVIPRGEYCGTLLVWMRGSYWNNRGRWDTAVVMTRLP